MTASVSLARPRSVSYRNVLGRYVPKRFSAPSRWRFVRDRQAGYLRRIGGGVPTEHQALIIQQLIEAEWSKLRCEHEAKNVAGKAVYELLRLAAEWSRQVLLLDRALVARRLTMAAQCPNGC
jgi:hypothetical protein